MASQDQEARDFSSPFTLYYATFSICATMVRTTFALRGAPAPSRPEMNLSFQLLNISPANPEQLSEFYLTQVNPKGLVPTLTNANLLDKPMPESLDISYYLAEWYPGLLPKEQDGVIRQLMEELHEISYAVLTYGLGTRHPGKMAARVAEVLAKPGLSEQYRKALEGKANVFNRAPAYFTEETLKAHENCVTELSTKILEVMKKRKSGVFVEDKTKLSYIFGPDPTVLDAHFLVLLARLADVDRGYVIPNELKGWLGDFRQSEVWKSIVPGGTTKPEYLS